MLKDQLNQIFNHKNLGDQKLQVKAMLAELGVEADELAAALLFIIDRKPETKESAIDLKISQRAAVNEHQPAFKMVRYSLSVGNRHGVTIDQLKKILVEESGVDIKNINIINMQPEYTVIEMPDKMPQDIFLHLKSVEINQQKLDIKRVKTNNNKKRSKNRSRRNRSNPSRSASQVLERVDG